MRKSLYMIKVELHRSVCSGMFYLQIGLTLMWMFLNCFEKISSEHGIRGMFALSMLDQGLTNVMTFSHLLLILGAVSFSWSYCTDLSCGYGKEVVRRAGLHTYGVSKIIAVAISSFCAAVAAILLFTSLILLLGFPWNAAPSYYSNAYMSLAADGGIISGLLYIVVRCLVTGISCSLAATASLCVSAYIRNVFASMLIPVLLYFVMELLALTGKYSLMAVMFTQVYPNEPVRSLAWAILYMTALILLFGKLFLYKIKKELCP